MAAISIVLAYDSSVLRTALRVLLESKEDIRVIGEADSPEQLLEIVHELHPKIVVCPVSPSHGFGLSLFSMLYRYLPDCRIVVLGPSDDLRAARLVLSNGVTAYIHQKSSVSILLHAIRKASKGRKFIDPNVTMRQKVATKADEQVNSKDEPKKPMFLSRRETEVLKLLAQGFTNVEVAQALTLTIKTTETYRVRLSQKLGAKSRADLFRYALNAGLIGVFAEPDGTDRELQIEPVDLPTAKPAWAHDTGTFKVDSTHLGLNTKALEQDAAAQAKEPASQMPSENAGLEPGDESLPPSR